MSFSIQLSSDLIAVEAGDNTPLNLQIHNRGEEVDRFEVEIEGLDPEWTAIPVPIFSVAAGETQTEKLFFKPGRASESLAGNYPFVVKVRSLNSAESRQAQGVVQIKPYNHLSMEILPKKGHVSPIRGAEIFHASVMNLGNTEQTLQLFGSDPEDAFAFEFGQEQLTVGPGQQKDIEVHATPTSTKPFASPRIYVFTLSARSIQTPSLVTSSQAQIEQRPVITPATLGVVSLVLLLIFVWYLSRPLPPVIQSLELEPESASYTEGEVVTVRWHAVHASGVILKIGDQRHDEPADGSTSFTAETSGTVDATAVEDRAESKPVSRSFEVKQPQIEPLPVIDNFEISQPSLNVGQSFIVHYHVSHATKVYLEPTATILDLNAEDYEVKPDQPGKTSYYLVAENATNKSVKSKTITVRVTQPSSAHIVFFDVSPKTVDPAANEQTTIQWQVTGAARITLTVGGATTDLPQASGSTAVPIDRNTDIYLTAYDSNGITVRSQHIGVHVKSTPPTQPTTPAFDTSTTGGGNNSPSSTGNNNAPAPTTAGGG
ncbi:MAG TPA: hypothetical protein VGL56_17575 [Fimbriimonadaceae bacterium]|jgi:hypothetical protein